jgi:GNAT superfamily N-acetyltransferase
VTEEATLVRLAKPTDREPVWPLARDLATSFRLERAAFDASFETLVGAEHALVLVAETPRMGVVGYLLAHSHGTFLANGPVAWVEEVMVDPQVRRTGVGRELMARAERWSQTVGAAYVALASRRAGEFYRALGYEDSAVFYRKLLP